MYLNFISRTQSGQKQTGCGSTSISLQSTSTPSTTELHEKSPSISQIPVGGSEGEGEGSGVGPGEGGGEGPGVGGGPDVPLDEIQ